MFREPRVSDAAQSQHTELSSSQTFHHRPAFTLLKITDEPQGAADVVLIFINVENVLEIQTQKFLSVYLLINLKIISNSKSITLM